MFFFTSFVRFSAMIAVTPGLPAHSGRYYLFTLCKATEKFVKWYRSKQSPCSPHMYPLISLESSS